jgi:hypothetical protein
MRVLYQLIFSAIASCTLECFDFTIENPCVLVNINLRHLIGIVLGMGAVYLLLF